MKIGRFLDNDGRIGLGIPQTGSTTAERLEGELYGRFEPVGEICDVAKWLAPITPTNIYCIGLNYRDHAAETGAPIPRDPVIFMKPTTAVTNPESPICLPACCEHGPEVDYEAELAVVIGKPGKDISLDNALDHVFGYTCANDVSARRWQKHGGAGQWIRGKSFDTFCPLGPILVTRDEIADPQALRLSCQVNDNRVQDGNTRDMIFSVAQLIQRLSRDTTLVAGTIILTGTPSGVGFTRKPPLFLQDGDQVSVSIEGIGSLNNSVESA